jgi:hypothetical protein
MTWPVSMDQIGPGRRERGRFAARQRASAAWIGLVMAVVLSVAAAFVVLRSSGGGSTTTMLQVPPGFVTSRGGGILVNGVSTKFVGWNTNGFPHIRCGGGPVKRADVDRYFAEYTNRNTWIRTWVFPGADLGELDYEIAAAKKTGAKLILTLSNSYPYCNDPGGEKSADWYRGGWRATHEAHIRNVVQRYKNEPGVAFWELQNEPHGAGNQAIKQFLTEASALIKGIDSRHLISSGSMPPYAYDGVAGYRDIHDVPGLDILSAHTYDEGMKAPGHLREAAEVATALNKPLYWGEMGLNAAPAQWAARRNQVMSQLTDAFATMPNLVGFSYWALNWNIDGPMNTGPEDPYLPAAIRGFRAFGS